MILASIFRDSTGYIPRYFEQVNALREHVDVNLVIAEGDSSDNTWDLLEVFLAPGDMLIKAAHGGPKFGSVDDLQRWRQIAFVCNKVWDRVKTQQPAQAIYVESDLVWPIDTMLGLVKALDEYDAVAPLSLSGTTGRFYDVWGYRKDGEPFSVVPPEGAPFPIDSAGSCIAMRANIIQAARFGDDDCVLGFGRSINAVGTLWCDPSLAVYHP